MKLLSPVVVVLLLLSLSYAFSEGDFFHKFFNPRLRHTPQFSGSGLFKTGVGLDNVQGSIGCFGDFNSDTYTDLFIINTNRTAIDVYLWDDDNWVFTKQAHIETPDITNIVADDFDYDGKLDLLVMGNQNKEINQTDFSITYLKLYLGDLTQLTQSKSQISDATDQVLVMDANGDLLPDLFGETGDDDPPRRAFWINKGGSFVIEYPSAMSSMPNPLAIPHSNAFADFNGDCMADLLVTSITPDGDKQYEIWINQRANQPTIDNWQLHDVVTLPPGSGQITVADFNGDGTLDLCVPVCYPPGSCSIENSVRIVYNSQIPLCPLINTKSSPCRKSTHLCDVDNTFTLSNVSVPIGVDIAALGLGGITTSAFGGSVFAYDEENGFPLVVRTGDYNLDGYADLIITLRDPSDNTSRVEIWTNSPSKRGFDRRTEGVTDLAAIPNAYAAAFFDLDENGNLDLLVLSDNPPTITALYNNFQTDAYFLKTIGLNGVCTAWCSSPKFPSPKPYQATPGGTFKFTITDLSGTTHVSIGAQQSQSAYLSLQTPYIMFGLGRTSNYIEQLFYGVPLNQAKPGVQYWTGSTIPNSQVVAIPYKPSEPTGWTLELYTNPSGVMFWVIVAVLISIILLGAAIYFLYRKEKLEDERHKQEVAHLFSFDAL